ncbi:T9SS type A sorting domain-containing protein [uncultured Algibacter sp.]|uniref:T9SS type A sorting domain-containing protein n=1 Tax=uncultured Algibacter sp. TaxID=298659 RepID=UPI0025DF622B|nr:T9SS type A sorting domain-containing protein [uncultured Algibacter sp.]
MIKKITQNVTKLIWRNSLFAFALLLSMTANSQVVGDEYLANPGLNSTLGTSTTPSTGVDGNGQMSASNTAGWTEYNSVAYIDSGGTDGNCHSEDRMFRLYKKGGTLGQFVAQTVTLPAGNYNWSFWTKWGAEVDYNAGAAEKPEFTISAGERVLQTTITTEPNAIQTWVEQTGVFNNQHARDITIKFYKYGGITNDETNLNQLMFVDDVSLKYASPFTYIEDDASLSDLTQGGATIAGFTEIKTTYDIFLAEGTTVVPTIVATPNNPSATAAITAATSIPGTTTIIITAEDGTTTNNVSINFSIPAPGQEFLTNPNINTTATSTDTGVDGSGNFPALGGWGSGANGSYAPTSSGNGDCHSEDRMFKFFAKNDAFVNQTVTLPAGTYDWSFWTRWAALVTWAADGDVKPKFTIMTDDDGDGTFTAVQTTITTQPTAVNSWVQQTGTYSNDISRQVRIKFSKSGGTDALPTNLNELMYIDDVSLKYNGANLGVSDQDIMSISIYPNPTSDFISIKGIENINSIKVYSILGALEKEVFNTNQIDISELSSGIHLIKIDNGTGTVFTEKIIKQ